MEHVPNGSAPSGKRSSVVDDTRHATSGPAAEQLARRYLEAQGLQCIETNFTRRVGEIDLVMRCDGGCIVFVEVRFRSSTAQGGALESLDRRKQGRLERAARAWLQRYGDDRVPARIDLIAVQPNNVPEAQAALPGEQRSELWESHRVIWVQNAV